MPIDPRTGETFARIVGKRVPPALGEVPPKETRDALAAMAQYRTKAPKGVFKYYSHAEMDADRERWLTEAMVERARGG
jgi:hypothetical protein